MANRAVVGQKYGSLPVWTTPQFRRLEQTLKVSIAIADAIQAELS
jgi:hypothetical protein